MALFTGWKRWLATATGVLVVALFSIVGPGANPSEAGGPSVGSWAHTQNCNYHGNHTYIHKGHYHYHTWTLETKTTSSNCTKTPLRSGHTPEDRLARIGHLRYWNEGQRYCSRDQGTATWHCHVNHDHPYEYCYTTTRCDTPNWHFSYHFSNTYSNCTNCYYQSWHNLAYHCRQMDGESQDCPS